MSKQTPAVPSREGLFYDKVNGLYYSLPYSSLNIEDNNPINTGETMNGFVQNNTPDTPYLDGNGNLTVNINLPD